MLVTSVKQIDWLKRASPIFFSPFPAGIELTSINIDSASGIFIGAPAQNLGGSFDNDSDTNIFKATFGSSFGSVSFGNVAQAGLSGELILGDLSVVGSLGGGGSLGEVDLVYIPVPEPSAIVLALLAVCFAGLKLLKPGRVGDPTANGDQGHAVSGKAPHISASSE